MKFFTIVFVGVFGIVIADFRNYFFNYGIVPDILDSPPAAQLFMKFGNRNITPGDIITPTEAKNPPEIYYNHQDQQFYTLIMSGPDAPGDSYETLPEFWHWAVVNIPGDDVSSGETLMGYITPSPPADDTLHRYVFLVYKQSGLIDFIEEPKISDTQSKGRSNKSVRMFSQKYNLGNPIAGNLIRAKADELSPQVREKMGL